jgi:hypothetical protein
VFSRTGTVTAAANDYTFAQIGSKPTTLAGYGITDPVVLTSGSYSNPAWITTLAWGKITGAPSFITGNQTITLTGDTTGSGATAITTTTSAVNGVTYPANPAVGTYPVVTSTNTVTYQPTPAPSTGTVSWVALSSPFNLLNQVGLQPLFGGTGGPLANGAITLAANTTYRFKCVANFTGLSVTTSGLQFGFGGTATVQNVLYVLNGAKANNTVGGATAYSTTAASTLIMAATTNANCAFDLNGMIRITTGGTLIPEIGMQNASAGVVTTDTFFEIWPIGSNTATSVGNWN